MRTRTAGPKTPASKRPRKEQGISTAGTSRSLNRRYAKPNPAGFQPNGFGSKRGLFRPGVRLDASQIRDARAMGNLWANMGGTPSRETKARLAARKINAGRGAISRPSQTRRKPRGRGFTR